MCAGAGFEFGAAAFDVRISLRQESFPRAGACPICQRRERYAPCGGAADTVRMRVGVAERGRDVGAGLPVILQDIRTPSGGSATTTTYLYGLGRIAETDGAGDTYFYLSDGLGSTTELTDDAGAVTDTYLYDVWGAVRGRTGTAANDFTFTGEQQDARAQRGLVYLRARHYDPALGRFLGRDPAGLGHAYAYAGNNPCGFTDPTGLVATEGSGLRCTASVTSRGVLRVLNFCVGLTIPFGGPQWCKDIPIGDLVDVLIDYEVEMIFDRTETGWNVSHAVTSYKQDHSWEPAWGPVISTSVVSHDLPPEN
jgi:RHS repeat-associated protein